MWRYKVVVAVAAVGMTFAGSPALAQGRGGMGMRGGMMGMRGSMTGMAADSATMAQMRVIHELVVNNTRITRTVTNLPDGIRTVTESDDPRLARLIRSTSRPWISVSGRVTILAVPMESRSPARDLPRQGQDPYDQRYDGRGRGHRADIERFGNRYGVAAARGGGHRSCESRHDSDARSDDEEHAWHDARHARRQRLPCPTSASPPVSAHGVGRCQRRMA